MEILIEQHPFRWYAPQNARSLIIGTFPPVRKRWSFDFFYPNKRNLFWKILAEIADMNITEDASTAIHQRKKILDKLHLAITDMGGSVRRMAGNSLDENLELVNFMPILDILDQYPTISRILLTSSTGKSSALGWFKLYLKEKNIQCLIPNQPKPITTTFCYKGKTIQLYVLYSPSSRASNRITFEALLNIYKNAILF